MMKWIEGMIHQIENRLTIRNLEIIIINMLVNYLHFSLSVTFPSSNWIWHKDILVYKEVRREESGMFLKITLLIDVSFNARLS